MVLVPTNTWGEDIGRVFSSQFASPHRSLRPASDSALVLFPGALGDFVCFLPTLRGLHARHPGPFLFIAKPALLELLQLPHATTASIDRREIADLFAVGSPLAAETRRLLGGFARAYSWTGFGDRDFAQRLASATGGRVDVFPFRGMEPGEHAVDYFARCADVSNTTPSGWDLAEDGGWLAAFLRAHDLDRRPLIVMHPGSGASKKNWVGFGVVARYWHQHHGSRVLFLHGPAESQHTAVANGATVLVDRLSLPQVVALLRRSRFYLGNDSGISHLAGAVGAPGLVLFGPTDPAVWAPRGSGLRVIYAPGLCLRCGADAFCLHRLAAETVVRALESWQDGAAP
jgi:ADP-heptose:LPS heptosyltransferase